MTDIEMWREFKRRIRVMPEKLKVEFKKNRFRWDPLISQIFKLIEKCIPDVDEEKKFEKEINRRNKNEHNYN